MRVILLAAMFAMVINVETAIAADGCGPARWLGKRCGGVERMSCGAPCVALDIADVDCPRRLPFRGVLTRLDEPSDAPPSGASGRRVVLTSGAAARALETILGMAVNATPSFDDHARHEKIGVITTAGILGNALVVSGYIYAADFPDIADAILDEAHTLGLSFEARGITGEDRAKDDAIEITELTFLGAAIVRKDKAAYQTTSLRVG